MKYRGRSGFTLVELLTVIAVIAVLAAMLFPVFVNAKKSAMKATCQSNLRQIGQAFESYTSDNGGCYPYRPDLMDGNTRAGECLWMGRFWRWPMRQYLKYRAGYNDADPQGAKQTTYAWNTILRCPADPVPGIVYDGTSYGYSAAFYHTPDQINSMTLSQLYTNPDQPMAVVKASSIAFPTKKALAADWISHTDKKATWWTWGGSRNYLFADGHVLYLSSAKIHPAGDGLPDINLTKDGVAGKDID